MSTPSGMSGEPGFDPERILSCLNENGVSYLVIGAVAALAHGAPVAPTSDVDITPSTSTANLERLSRALTDLGARLRVNGVEEGLEFSHDAVSIARMRMLNLTCGFGDFDVSLQPSGTAGYDDLIRSALRLQIGNTETYVASLRDVIRSKAAAGRPKDLAVLPDLEAFAESQGGDDEPQPM